MSSATENTILEFRDVCFSYDNSRVLIDQINLSVSNGEFIGLLGANGSGKSTILKLASGILKQARGIIYLWGKPVHSYRNRDRAKLLSYLPQVLDISIPFTVREVVSMGLYPYDIMPPLSTDEALEMVGLSVKADSVITNLSGGERRRVYIAMTLLQGAGLVLLDEPLANLDIRYQMELLRLLKELRAKRGITTIMALHDINIALQFDRLMVIKEGKIIGTGTSDEIVQQDLLKKAFDIDIEIKREETGGVYIKY